MHKCTKRMKVKEAEKMTEKEDMQMEDVGTTLPQFDEGAHQICLTFQEWMTSNNMGAENTTNLYVNQVKGFLVYFEDLNASFIANNLLSPVST